MNRAVTLSHGAIDSPLHITDRWPLYGLIGSVAFRYTGERLSLIWVKSFDEILRNERASVRYAELLQRMDAKQEVV